jgi:hypothetical protein
MVLVTLRRPCRMPAPRLKGPPTMKNVMRRLSALLAALAWLGLVSLLSYELVQKSPDSPLGPLPGHEVARRADLEVRFRASTGLPPLDRLLHEGQEAFVYYRTLIQDPDGQ